MGGTFTDVIALDPVTGRIQATIKLPSTPARPDEGAIEGVERYLARAASRLGFVSHGTTVGTNTLIEKRGARVALITTEGFRDVLALRRQARPQLYDLQATVSPPLAERALRLEVRERMSYDGQVQVPLDESSVQAAVAQAKAARAEAVVIALLHSYANPAHELAVEAAVRAALPDIFVCRSSDVCPEFREFERTSTATVNAYIGPAVSDYFARLQIALTERGGAGLGVMKSNGGLASVANAIRYPVHLIESGPAAGVIATAALGREQGWDNLIAFDMGGTTAKVGVVLEGQPRLSTEFYADRYADGSDMGGYPIQSPVVDLMEIGAGGGSIAWIDDGGLLRVGPQSSGAEPGPACYARGGTRATVTDAHVVLGHITAAGFGSEDLTIDEQLAREAVSKDIAKPLQWTVERAAWSIVQIATNNMAELVRLATLRRGLDPRDFALVAFGGAGGLHAADIAREVGIGQVIIPPVPGLFSAIGTVLGDLRHDLVQTVLQPLVELEASALHAVFTVLRDRADGLKANEDLLSVDDEWVLSAWLDLRFERQLFELSLPFDETLNATSLTAVETAFRQAYIESYGYDLSAHRIEVVNARLVASFTRWRAGWPGVEPSDTAGITRQQQLIGANAEVTQVAVLRRETLAAGRTIDGPAIIEDFGATIRVLAEQQFNCDESGIITISNRVESA